MHSTTDRREFLRLGGALGLGLLAGNGAAAPADAGPKEATKRVGARAW
jgi:hypothetical protein